MNRGSRHGDCSGTGKLLARGPAAGSGREGREGRAEGRIGFEELPWPRARDVNRTSRQEAVRVFPIPGRSWGLESTSSVAPPAATDPRALDQRAREEVLDAVCPPRQEPVPGAGVGFLRSTPDAVGSRLGFDGGGARLSAPEVVGAEAAGAQPLDWVETKGGLCDRRAQDGGNRGGQGCRLSDLERQSRLRHGMTRSDGPQRQSAGTPNSSPGIPSCR